MERSEEPQPPFLTGHFRKGGWERGKQGLISTIWLGFSSAFRSGRPDSGSGTRTSSSSACVEVRGSAA